jgi:hypothetical protein
MPTDPSLLEAALIGYQLQRDRIDKAIAELRQRLGGQTAHAVSAHGERPRRKMSAAARKRIAAAQKKRWAEFHKKRGN